jgi:RNA polymerase sigma-70 factor (ECF subfamily)
MSDDTPTAAADQAKPADVRSPDELMERLAEQYRGRLRVFATRRLRGDSAAAEDVVQEALRVVLEALRAGRVRESAALAGFVFETARNLCLHQARSRSREWRALERLAVSPPVESPDVLGRLIGEERRCAVRAALDRLNDDDRRLLVMTYVHARDSEDIGRELGLSPGAVRVRRHRALKRLSVHLGVTVRSGVEPR